MITRAHTIQNAGKAGLALCGQEEDGTPEWIGTQEQWKEFRLLEADPELI
jgi:hypothetical protein